MPIADILGHIGAIIIGFVMGLFGGGGSILAVPVLSYLFFLPASIATAYSLFIVGFCAIIGVMIKGAKGEIHRNSAIFFGLPSIIGAFFCRKWLIPSLPEQIVSSSYLSVSKDQLMLLSFAVIMLIAAYKMIRSAKQRIKKSTQKARQKLWQLSGIGAAVGVTTGFVGAGGGFLIVPVLHFFAKLPIKRATATSLVIIALNANAGFLGALSSNLDVAWDFLARFISLSLLGLFAGIKASARIQAQKIKSLFGWFIVVIGCFIISRETGLF